MTMDAVCRALLGASLIGATGCAGNLYELPPPPPEAERQSVSLIPGEEQRKREEEYLLVKASVLKLAELLASKRFEESLEWMSYETRDFIGAGSARRDPIDVLSSGQYQLSPAQIVPFDPIPMLLASDLSTLQDSAEGMSKVETARRREIFAIVAGVPNRIILIKQGDRWVLHRTSFPKAP